LLEVYVNESDWFLSLKLITLSTGFVVKTFIPRFEKAEKALNIIILKPLKLLVLFVVIRPS